MIRTNALRPLRLRGAVLPLLLLSLTASLVGCGGGGSSSGSSTNGTATPTPIAATPTPTPNPAEPPVEVQRHWTGPWVATDNSQSGSYDIRITADGKVTGTVHNATYSQDGAVNGTIDSSGVYRESYSYSGTNYTSLGSAHVDASTGHLIFVDDNYSGGVKFLTISANLIAQPD